MNNHPNSPPMVLTTNGMDCFCCAAAVLIKHPDATIRITSRNVLHRTLNALAAEISRLPDEHGSAPELPAGPPSELWLTGVGVGNLEAVVEELNVLRACGISVRWFCGRGYLNAHQASLEKVCKLHFAAAPTNTQLMCDYLTLPEAGPVPLLKRLAQEFVATQKKKPDLHKPPPKLDDWHALVRYANEHYLRCRDKDYNQQVLRILAGLVELGPEDQQNICLYRDRVRSRPLREGRSKAMKAVSKLIGQMSSLEEPVLILGPSGVGKELVASDLHYTSPRRHGPYLEQNCAILSTDESLANDRLFGHVKGAFTGADRDSPGAFEKANGGTLFLDEVGELPLSVQTKLLRVLDDMTITRMGEQTTLNVDVRVIAATNRDLGQMVRENLFRLDLYYRLSTLIIHVPALHDRIEDTREIYESLRRELVAKGVSLELKETDWQLLDAYAWPGNVRQFRSVLKRAAYLKIPIQDVLRQEQEFCKSLYSAEADLATSSEWPHSPAQVRPFDAIKREYALHVLKLYDHNITQTAKALGIAANTLRSYMK